jgi:hypothetical protein
MPTESIPYSMVEEASVQQFRQCAAASYRYLAYGLVVCADTALPELFAWNPESGSGDVVLEEGSIGLPMCAADHVVYRPVSADVIVVQWASVGALSVQRGRRIVYERAPGVCPVVFRMFLVCQGLGVILQQRRMLVLHASCVVFGDSAVAFAGVCGAGKSTLAAASCQKGARLLADDVLAVSVANDGAATALPGFARIKMLPDSSLRFSPSAAQGAQPIGDFGKFLHDATAQFTPGGVPLRRVYLIESGDSVGINVLALRDAFPVLTRHTYGRALLPHLKLEGLHLQQCCHLIRSRAVRQLRRPRDFDRLSEIVDAVRANLE